MNNLVPYRRPERDMFSFLPSMNSIATNESDVEVARIKANRDVTIAGISAQRDISLARMRIEHAETVSMISGVKESILGHMRSNPGKSNYEATITDNKWFGKKYTIKSRSW